MKVFALAGSNNKAIVTQKDGKSILTSYVTGVAEYNHLTNEIKVFGLHSQTTTKHINLFLEFYGFDKMTKKELIEMYNLTDY